MGGPPTPCLALLRVGFTSRQVALDAGALLPHRFTLACAYGEPCAIGGLFSVALSCGSPRLTHVSTLPYGAPTFLNASPRRGHLADSPPVPSMHPINPRRTGMARLIASCGGGFSEHAYSIARVARHAVYGSSALSHRVSMLGVYASHAALTAAPK